MLWENFYVMIYQNLMLISYKFVYLLNKISLYKAVTWLMIIIFSGLNYYIFLKLFIFKVL